MTSIRGHFFGLKGSHMISVLLGTKINQSQTFTSDGKRIPVTTIQAGPCWVTQLTNVNDQPWFQLGFGIANHITKACEGHIKKTGLTIKPRFLRSFKDESQENDLKIGTEIRVENVFSADDRIRVTATSKGKGFAGVVKRHHFRGGPKTHGQSDRERAPGSIGQTTTPGRVYRGKRMAGRMGHETVAVRGLSVVSVDPEKHILTIAGLVPGPKGSLVIIKKEPAGK